jgi:hypothetical protein
LSFFDIEHYNFFRRFFGTGRDNIEREVSGGARKGEWNRRDIFREFDDMQREMERMFEQQF